MAQPQRNLPWHVTNESDPATTHPSTVAPSLPSSATSLPSSFTASTTPPTLSIFGSFAPRPQLQLHPQSQPQVQLKLSGQMLRTSGADKGSTKQVPADRAPDQEIIVRLPDSERSSSPHTKSPGHGYRERSSRSTRERKSQTDRSRSPLNNNFRKSRSSHVGDYKISELPTPLIEIMRKRSRNDIEIHRAEEQACRAKMRALEEESRCLEMEEQLGLERWLQERNEQKE